MSLHTLQFVIADLQILSIKMPQSIQEAQESPQDQVDQGLS